MTEPTPPAPSAGDPDTAPPSEPDVPPPTEPDVAPATDAAGPAPNVLDVPAEPVRSSPPSGPSDGGSPARLLGFLGAFAAGILVTMAALAATGSLDLGAAASATPEPSASEVPSPSPEAFAEGRSQGDPNAPVTVEIWADFQCPYCALLAKGVEPEIVREYAATGRAVVVYRDFAFLGDESFDSAVAARCAGDQGRFWHYHDLLFASQQGENQGAFARDRLVSLAGFAGLDEATFTACLDDPTVRSAVEAETAEGRTDGITSTPTTRIVGPGGTTIVSGLKPLAEFAAAFDQVATPGASGSPSPGASDDASPEPSPSPSPGS